MDRERITTTLFAALAGLAVAAQPVAAQASSSDAAITSLNEKLLVVAIPITVLVEAVLIYTVFKYKDADEAKPTRENRRLEITWTIATAAVLLFVGISASITMADNSVITPDSPQISEDAEQVNVTAFRYGWNFAYPEYNVSSSSAQSPLYVVQGQETYFSLTTEDWLHAFHVPTLGLKHDAVPGKIAWMKTTPLEVGTYQGYCAEYCGTGHSGMMFEVQVLEDREALLSEMEAMCNSTSNKTWNAQEETCAWNGSSSSGSSGNASNSTTASSGASASTNSVIAPSSTDVLSVEARVA